MKVLHLIGGLRGGGAEHMLLELCIQSLSDPVLEMSVSTLTSMDDIRWKFDDAGVPVSSPPRRNSQLSEIMFAVRTLVKNRPPVIHAHLFHAAAAACLVKCFVPRTRIIFSLHNERQPNGFKRWILWLTRPLRHRDVVFPGMPRKWYLKARPAVIPNGISFQRFQRANGIKPTVFNILWVGRLEKQKNPLALVRLALFLREKGAFLIRVAGHGSLKECLIKEVEKRGLSAYFDMVGYSDDMPSLLSAAHCLVVTSRWEGMPLVVLEAGAAALPVACPQLPVLSAMLGDDATYFKPEEAWPAEIEKLRLRYTEACEKAALFRDKVRQEYGIELIYNRYFSELYKK